VSGGVRYPDAPDICFFRIQRELKKTGAPGPAVCTVLSPPADKGWGDVLL
jgi:hypothetical protein